MSGVARVTRKAVVQTIRSWGSLRLQRRPNVETIGTAEFESIPAYLKRGWNHRSWHVHSFPYCGASAAALVTLTMTSVGIADWLSLPSSTIGEIESCNIEDAEEKNTRVDPYIDDSAREKKSDPKSSETEEVHREVDAFRARALAVGVITINSIVFGAFWYGRFLYYLKPGSTKLIALMNKNFILSPVGIRAGRWHTIFTHMFAHWSLFHLLENCFATWLGFELCSPFMNSWKEMLLLYVTGNIIGGAATLTVCSIMRKSQYQGYYMGGSPGVYALFNFLLGAKDRGSSFHGRIPLDWFDILCISILTREIVAVLLYLRRGIVLKGLWRSRSNHVGHLAGAITGLVGLIPFKALDDNTANSGNMEENAVDSITSST